MKKSLYDILGVKKNASKDEIKQAYRDKSKENHPDKNGDPEKMAEVNHAKDILINPISRRRYDETGSDKNAPAFEQRFAAQMDSLLMQIVSNPDADVKTMDIISIMKDSVKEGLKGLQDRKKEVNKSLNTLHIIKKKTKSKGDNTIISVIDGNIENLNITLATISEDIEFTKKCIAALKDYTYDFDKEEGWQLTMPQEVTYTRKTTL